MDFVEPIRDRKKIAQIKTQLEGAKRFRDLLLFVVGINSALRVSDLLTLRIADFIGSDGVIRPSTVLREEKRNKRTVVTINSSIQETIHKFLIAYPGITQDANPYVFFATKGNQADYSHAITVERAWQIVSTMCEDVGLLGNYGTHTLRKTWGYHARKQGIPLE